MNLAAGAVLRDLRLIEVTEVVKNIFRDFLVQVPKKKNVSNKKLKIKRRFLLFKNVFSLIGVAFKKSVLDCLCPFNIPYCINYKAFNTTLIAYLFCSHF